MARLRWNRQLVFGLGSLVGFVACWVLGGGVVSSPLHAQSGVPLGGHETGTLAFTTIASDSSQHLYIIDTRTQSFAVYRVEPKDPKGAVKLEAARQYRYDLKLAEFNNQAPEVATIESMVAAPRK